MESQHVGQRLKEFLIADGTTCNPGALDEQVTQFERRHNIQMPTDFKEYLIAMNGSQSYAYGIIRFWSLDEMKSVAQELSSERLPRSTVIQTVYDRGFDGAKHYFLFADFLHESQLYAIYLTASLDVPNAIVLLDGTAPIHVADSFTDFVDKYFTAPESLRLAID